MLFAREVECIHGSSIATSFLYVATELTYVMWMAAAGASSKSSWLFGGFGAWMKLPANNSAGTVTTLYVSFEYG